MYGGGNKEVFLKIHYFHVSRGPLLVVCMARKFYSDFKTDHKKSNSISNTMIQRLDFRILISAKYTSKFFITVCENLACQN